MAEGDGFCGNPVSHPRHEEWGGHWCAGVYREEQNDVIYTEKFDPSNQAEDGTEYKKVTILIEDKNGDVTIVHAPRASMPNATAKTDGRLPLDQNYKEFYPTIDFVEFKFMPHKFGDDPALSIERKLHADS